MADSLIHHLYGRDLRLQEALRPLRHCFTWPPADLLAQLRPQQAYWLAMRVGRGLDQMREMAVRNDLGVRAFDVFCPGSLRPRCRGPPGHFRRPGAPRAGGGGLARRGRVP